jgi:hypothetical protein
MSNAAQTASGVNLSALMNIDKLLYIIEIIENHRFYKIDGNWQLDKAH